MEKLIIEIEGDDAPFLKEQLLEILDDDLIGQLAEDAKAELDFIVNISNNILRVVLK